MIESFTINKDFILSVVASLTATILFLLFSYLAGFIGKNFSFIRNKKIETFYPFSFLKGYLISLLLVTVIYKYNYIEIKYFHIFIVFSTITFLIVLLYLHYEYKKVGIVGVDSKIKKKRDYKNALKTVRSEYKFLGVGSSKLTEHENEFEQAIRNSTSTNRSAKFLLCDPNSPALIKIAKKANKTGDEVNLFSRSVIKSLEKLANLKEKGLNIDVRLYTADNEEDMPIFRLMFFNNKYCLASYTIFGVPNHEGEQLPQLHIQIGKESNAENSYYYAFDKYFERLWNNKDIKQWDYKEWLK